MTRKASIPPFITRRRFLGVPAAALLWGIGSVGAQSREPDNRPLGSNRGHLGCGEEEYPLPADLEAIAWPSLVLGRVSDRSITVSTMAKEPVEGYIEYGTETGRYGSRSGTFALSSGAPGEQVLADLAPDTEYVYRLQWRRAGGKAFQAKPECRFHTRRAAGRTFIFCVQGDSHPERMQMSAPQLYTRTLLNAAASKPDFYICMGDDFSVDTLRTVSAEAIDSRYALQRPFLGLVAQSAPVFFVNGNHEQGSLFNFSRSDVRHEVAVDVQRARNRYYPVATSDSFYSADTQSLEGIGPLNDYCAWTWGDALFVILDNYWHSAALVDNGFREGPGGPNRREEHGARDGWGRTLGDSQYRWLKQTLEQSKARHKFVFAHHVLGTGRGGIEEADLYEWGGRSKRGDWEFNQNRPDWETPIHQLMVKHGVSIFFQGHDHLFCRQQRDGIIYQEVPMPADPGYAAHNADRYQTGVTRPNSGYLRVTVSPEETKVDYVRCFLPKDENEQRKTGQIEFSYTVQPKGSHA